MRRADRRADEPYESRDLELGDVLRSWADTHAASLSLQTETDNASALALYAEAGFQPVDGLELLNLALVPEKAP
jgi:hypothetical protein